MSRDETFLSRWSRRKRANTGDEPVEQRALPSQSQPQSQPTPQPQPAQGPLPAAGGPVDAGASVRDGSTAARTAVPAADPGDPDIASAGETRDGEPGQGKAALPPLESLGPDSDFTGFMQAGVDPSTRASALRRLFADPHFNQMDGLDIYIDDYGKPDPIPLAMLKMMKQAHSLGLFDSPDESTDDDSRDADGPHADSHHADSPRGVSAHDHSTNPQAPAGDALARAEPDRDVQPGDDSTEASAKPRPPARS